MSSFKFKERQTVRPRFESHLGMYRRFFIRSSDNLNLVIPIYTAFQIHTYMEHAYSGYSLPKRDSIHQERSGNCVRTLSLLYPLSHHGWMLVSLIDVAIFNTSVITPTLLFPYSTEEYHEIGLYCFF